jgi:hypothetical protein
MKLYEINTLFHTTDYRYLRIHARRICNDTLHDFTLIKMIASRFVGKECFLIRYSNGHTK